jgi:hypothetical protein
MNIYYVYAYIRQSNSTPYYIGKGKGNRAYDKRHSVSVPKDKSKIIFLETNLSEEVAFDIERTYISLLGRKDLGTGILYNRTDGGDGVAGKVYTEEQCKQRSLRAMGNQHAKNTIYTEEMRKARSIRAMGNQSGKGSKGHVGMKRSEETKKNIGAPRIGSKWWTNGTENKVCKECPSPEWRRGRTLITS